MIGYVMVGTNNLDRAATFYDSVLTPLDLIQVERTSTYVAFAPKAAKGDIEFYVTKPFDKRPAKPGNGIMVALQAASMQALERFHSSGLKSGGIDEGAPGPRDEGSKTCYAYIRDLDGNKICAFCDAINA